jgi:hypothetical protein
VDLEKKRMRPMSARAGTPALVALALGVVLAAASPAGAAIVYNDFPDVTFSFFIPPNNFNEAAVYHLSPAVGQSYQFDFGFLNSNTEFPNVFAGSGHPQGLAFVARRDNSPYAARYGAGTVIGGATAPGSDVRVTYEAGDPETVDDWQLGGYFDQDDGPSTPSPSDWSGSATVRGYLGVRLRMSDDIGEYFGFAWLDMAYDDPSNTFTFYAFAYETSRGVGIAAGDTGSSGVPEPTTLALASLGAAAALARGRGRRAAG